MLATIEGNRPETKEEYLGKWKKIIEDGTKERRKITPETLFDQIRDFIHLVNGSYSDEVDGLGEEENLDLGYYEKTPKYPETTWIHFKSPDPLETPDIFLELRQEEDNVKPYSIDLMKVSANPDIDPAEKFKLTSQFSAQIAQRILKAQTYWLQHQTLS